MFNYLPKKIEDAIDDLYDAKRSGKLVSSLIEEAFSSIDLRIKDKVGSNSNISSEINACLININNIVGELEASQQIYSSLISKLVKSSANLSGNAVNFMIDKFDIDGKYITGYSSKWTDYVNSNLSISEEKLPASLKLLQKIYGSEANESSFKSLSPERYREIVVKMNLITHGIGYGRLTKEQAERYYNLIISNPNSRSIHDLAFMNSVDNKLKEVKKIHAKKVFYNQDDPKYSKLKAKYNPDGKSFGLCDPFAEVMAFSCVTGMDITPEDYIDAASKEKILLKLRAQGPNPEFNSFYQKYFGVNVDRLPRNMDSIDSVTKKGNAWMFAGANEGEPWLQNNNTLGISDARASKESYQHYKMHWICGYGTESNSFITKHAGGALYEFDAKDLFRSKDGGEIAVGVGAGEKANNVPYSHEQLKKLLESRDIRKNMEYNDLANDTFYINYTKNTDYVCSIEPIIKID